MAEQQVATVRPAVPAVAPPRGGIRARVLILLLFLLPAAVYLMTYGMWVAGGGGSAMDSLISFAVAGLGVLVGLNHALKRWKPQWMLTGGEIIVIYVCLIFGVGLTGSTWDWGGPIITVTTWPVWNAGPENGWQALIWPNLPPWLTVLNRDVLAGLYLGETNPYQAEILRAWLTPALWWTLWATALVWVSLCLNVIVRKRWSEEEKLGFPMTILPLQMTAAGGALFRNSLFWIGCLLPVGIIAIDTVARFLPAVPTIPMSVDISRYINNNKPFDVLRTPTLGWGLWATGLSYLMPTDLAFSMIVFNLFWRAEYVVTRTLGWTMSAYGGFPYGDQQSIGGYLALMTSVVWLDRRYLGQVLRKAIGLHSRADDREEAFSYRTAVFGALLGLVFLYTFLTRAGLGAAVAVAFLLLYFTMALAMSRMRAHLGPPNHEMYGSMPTFVFTEFPGNRALGSRALGALTMLRPYLGEQRPNPAPAQLEALRMAERAPINPKRLGLIMVAVIPLIMVSYFWANLHIGYHLGMSSSKASSDFPVSARIAIEGLDGSLRDPAGPNWGGVEAIGVGFGVSLLLMALKLQWPAWPLHPVAFPLAFCYPIDAMLPSIVIAWAAKALLLRYGGLRAHRTALPLFLGFIVGSATGSLLQTILYRSLGIR